MSRFSVMFNISVCASIRVLHMISVIPLVLGVVVGLGFGLDYG